MSLIQRFIEKSKERRPSIGVVGDAMIDQYFSVNVNRMSPEFPIPVIKVSSELPDHSLPGGAANVCHQLSLTNANSRLISILDKTSKKAIDGRNIDTSLCKLSKYAEIPIKKRYYHGEQPFYRIDIEKDSYGLSEVELRREQAKLFDNYRGQKDDILILSDYNKGVFLLDENRWTQIGIPTIIDPKGPPIERWKGCTIFKPNSEEAEKLSGEKYWWDQVEFFKKTLNCESVVITIGGNGVVGWDGKRKKLFEYFNQNRVLAKSVIGAGDCFAAFLALAYVHDFTVSECAEIAFKAGMAYVQNMHNHPISYYNLLQSEDPILAKYLDSAVPKKGTTILANGCYDIITSAHLKLLEFSKTKADNLIVALNSNASIKRLKGDSRPINSLEDRMRMIASLSCVDFVCSFEEDTPYELIKKIKPDFLIKGSDYKDKEIAGSDLVKEVFLFDYIEGISTTEIIRKIMLE